MAAVAVRHELLDAAGEPVPGRAVTARLIAPADWLADDSGSIITAARAVSGEDGLVTLRLTPQSEIAATGTYYEVRPEKTTVVWYCVVPDAGPVQLAAIMVDPDTLDPVGPDLDTFYLTRAERGAANGVAPLGADGKVPAANLPTGSSGELDADLVAIAALTPANDDVIQRKAGAWTNRTPAQVKTDLALVKADVGLSNVDNTSDANKPVSTATQTALDGKQNLDADLTAIAALAPSNDDVLQRKAGAWTNRTPAQVKTDLGIATGDVSGFTAAVVALVDAGIAALVDGAPGALDTLNELAAALADDAGFAATITSALAGKQPLDADLTALAALAPANDDVLQRKAGAWTNRTPAQVKTDLALVKGDVGLSNVDNTADTAKPVSTAQATAIGNRGVQATASSGLQNVTFTGDTSGSWTLCPAEYRVTIAAAVGDVLLWEPHLLVNAGADAELDVASVISGAAARYFSSGTAVQGANGHGGLYIGTVYNRALKAIRWIVTADDLDAGNVTLALLRRDGSGVTFGHAVYPGQVDVTNLGGVPA